MISACAACGPRMWRQGRSLNVELATEVCGLLWSPVEGTVYTADRKAAAFAIVTLVPSLEHRQNPDLFKTVSSDALGHFVISGVRPDDYKLFAWDKVAPGASHNASFVAKYEAQGSSVRVAAGAKAAVDVSIITDGSAR